MTYAKKLKPHEFSLWRDKRPLLGQLDIELTERCNNACLHCLINRPEHDDGARLREMDADFLQDLLRQAADLGCLTVRFTGGEPLLREDFAEIYRMLKSKGLLVSVFTNATLIRAEHLALFRQYPPRDIEVTVYGATARTFERVARRPGSFDAFQRGLDALLEAGIRIRLKAMAMRSNLHEMEAIAAFGRSRTKDFYRFDPQLHLRFDGDAQRNQGIKEERLTPEEIVALERADEQRFGALLKACDKLIQPELAHFGCDHLFHCGAGNGSFNVGYDGTYRLCSSLWAPEATVDLRQTSLRQALEEHVPKVRELRSQRKEFLQTCRRCELINLCLWCPAHAHLETGEMDGATPYFCEVAHARARQLRVSSCELRVEKRSENQRK